VKNKGFQLSMMVFAALGLLKAISDSDDPAKTVDVYFNRLPDHRLPMDRSVAAYQAKAYYGEL